MSDRDTLGGDDKEPWRGASERGYSVSRDQFQNLYDDVHEISGRLSSLCGDVKVIKQYVENQKDAENKRLTKWGILVSVLSIVFSYLTSRAVNP